MKIVARIVASWLIIAALCGTVSAQTIVPAEPRYLEPVYLRLPLGPYTSVQSAQVSMEGSTIIVTIQSIPCSDLCSDLIPADIQLGRFPAGTYIVLFKSPGYTVSNQFTVAGPNDPLILVDYSGMWWLPSESGWGISIWQAPTNLIFAVWFVYDPAGTPTWYTLQAQGTSQGPYTHFGGTIFKTNGPYFGGQFDPSLVGIVPSGSGSLYFGNSNSGVFQYVVDGVQGRKYITRQIIE
jgi:hypothetical protein